MDIKKVRIAVAGAVALTVVAVLAVKIVLRGDFTHAGTIEATEVDLSARIASVISRVEVKEGQSVGKGHLLAELSCEDIKLAADLAEDNYRRARTLYAAGSMPQSEYDRLRYIREDAAVRRGWCRINSPIDGVVLSVYFEEGELVGPGTKIMTVARVDEVWAFFYVPAPMLARLKLDMKVKGFLPELKGTVFEGRISHIRDKAEFTPKNVQTREDRTRLVYGVKVVFRNPERVLKPGMSIEAGF